MSGFDARVKKKKNTPIGMSAADIVGCCNPSSNPNSCYLAGNSCPANNYLVRAWPPLPSSLQGCSPEGS